MKLLFTSLAWEDYQGWAETDRNILARLNTVISDTRRHPFSGIGKPEPLRGHLAGWWSRRITGEHRLVYRVSGKAPEQVLEIASCRYHYARD